MEQFATLELRDAKKYRPRTLNRLVRKYYERSSLTYSLYFCNGQNEQLIMG